jgi:hypothetical protein
VKTNRIYIPPNGFGGQGQQTTANQLVGTRPARSGVTRRRRRKVAKRAAPRRRKRTSSKRPARLVKGSAAAKRYMASIRRKRKR